MLSSTTIDVHPSGPARPKPGPTRARSPSGRAWPGTILQRVSPRASPTAQAWAHRPVSCRASPLIPACLSGSGHARPTKGEPATARHGRAGRGLAGGGAAECDGGGEARGEEVRRSAELLVGRGRRLGARRRGERRSRVSRLGLREEARGRRRGGGGRRGAAEEAAERRRGDEEAAAGEAETSVAEPPDINRLKCANHHCKDN